MSFSISIGIGAVALLAGSVAAQRPDFSGRWTTQPDPAATAQRGSVPDSAQGQRGGRAGGGRGGRVGDMGSGWGSTITIAQDANALTVEYAFFGRGDMQPPLRFIYALDGSETKNSVMMGRGTQTQLSKAMWDADKLVITTRHSFANPENGQPMTSEVTQTLSLESAAALVVETVRGGVMGGPASTTRTVYRKL